MRVVAAWLRDDSDPVDETYEAEFTATLPHGPGEAVFAQFAPFKLANRLHRLIAPEVRIFEYFGPGVLVIACRIRRAGTDEWIGRAEYPILLEGNIPAPPAPPPAST
jgi:hypothetical protein